MRNTKKVITAAGVIALGAFVMIGILLYKVGEDMTYLHRCGHCKRDYFKYEDIIALGMNEEKFRKHLNDFMNGIMPNQKPEQEAAGQQETESKEFGWLSPAGEFTESPFGNHEESAEEICEKKGFNEEYRKWRKDRAVEGDCLYLRRDFLSIVKGYCLIHNPSGYGGYIVTNMKNLTKKQKDFLYGYFMDMGDRFKAEQFVE